MRATTIIGPNAHLLQRYALPMFQLTEWSKHAWIRLRGVEGGNACDQIAFCVFHLFLVEVQTNTGYIHVTHA